MRPKYGLSACIFTATPRPLLNCIRRFVSLLINVHTEGARFVTTISKELAAPRVKLWVPLSRAPRSCVLAPPSKTTITSSAPSFNVNETLPFALRTPDAYGLAIATGLKPMVTRSAAQTAPPKNLLRIHLGFSRVRLVAYQIGQRMIKSQFRADQSRR